jgi:DNA-binding response OmpR family regulator
VLVIDDDGYSALLTRALVKGGFSVARAANGTEAFVEVESTDFDVALLDVHLPDVAIARGIVVDRHEGEIRLESRQGMGTTFFVRLPIAEPVPAS